MMELKEGTGVFTPSGKRVGNVDRFVLGPKTNEVTHLVVKKGWLLPEDKVVPFDMVRSATEDKVVLKEDVDDFEKLPPFEETHYVEAADQQGKNRPYPTYKYVRAYYLYPPVGYLGYPAYGLRPYSWPPVETERNIPENTVPLQEGAEVFTSDDKHVGKIEQLFIQPDSDKVSHVLVSDGVLNKDRKLVPVSWVESVAEDKVLLSVPSRQLEDLPPYKS